MSVYLQLYDSNSYTQLLPLTYTRPVAALRVGILTIAEKWQRLLSPAATGYSTQPHLSAKYTALSSPNLFVYGGLLPTPQLVDAIATLPPDTALCTSTHVLAHRVASDSAHTDTPAQLAQQGIPVIHWPHPAHLIQRPHDLFTFNALALEADFELLTAGRTAAAPSSTNRVIGERVFIEPSAQVECAILNSTTGPIYIGSHAVVMEGSAVRGGLALCEHAELKLNTKIYGATTIGPYCKVGGEVNNSILTGYSSKAHDGFLGNSVLGEWCNLGADTNNSNLKNNYAEVKLWNYASGRFDRTGLQFCGLIMGDHSKCGINTMFNTGTVVGVSANIFGAGFPRQFVPSFVWGGAHGFEEYALPKAFEVAERVMIRRNRHFDTIEQNILRAVFEADAPHRAHL